jgi:hypothetical protein
LQWARRWALRSDGLQIHQDDHARNPDDVRSLAAYRRRDRRASKSTDLQAAYAPARAFPGHRRVARQRKPDPHVSILCHLEPLVETTQLEQKRGRFGRGQIEADVTGPTARVVHTTRTAGIAVAPPWRRDTSLRFEKPLKSLVFSDSLRDGLEASKIGVCSLFGFDFVGKIAGQGRSRIGAASYCIY